MARKGDYGPALMRLIGFMGDMPVPTTTVAALVECEDPDKYVDNLIEDLMVDREIERRKFLDRNQCERPDADEHLQFERLNNHDKWKY